MNRTDIQLASRITPRLASRYWRAALARDARADGAFFIAVRSTNIYCRPSCPARRPLRRNVVFFRTRQEAERHGFRPCLRCHPNEAAAGAVALVEKASRCLAASGDGGPDLAALAAEIGASTSVLRRAFVQVTGLRPRELAGALRLARFKQLLRAGKAVAEALYETGYGSASRVYENSNAQLGMTPAIYRQGGKGMNIGYATAKCSLGNVLVAATGRGISAVYVGDSASGLVSELRLEYPRAEISAASRQFRQWVQEVVRRVEGKPPRLDLPLDLLATAFQRRVWQELQRIPRGSTRTYTQVARALGAPNSVRAVARACATNPVSIVVPCHRVVRQDGSLAGYRWGLERKQALLDSERATPSRSKSGLRSK